MTVITPNYYWAYALTPRSLTTHLILHHAAASSETPEAIHAYHKSKGWAGIAYHYYVRKDGTVYRGRPETMRGGHTTNWNYCSIGICFEGNLETETMPEAQIKAGQELIADIKARYPGIVIGRHKDYQATACPGANFPFNTITAAPSETVAEDNNEPSAWAKPAWTWAEENGLMDGTNPKNAITREEVAMIIMRMEARK
jgi:N-acetyl-anhydromuramyl-L-alanine amidase AmpD